MRVTPLRPVKMKKKGKDVRICARRALNALFSEPFPLALSQQLRAKSIFRRRYIQEGGGLPRPALGRQKGLRQG